MGSVPGIAAVVIVIITLGLGYIAASAQGAPSAPTASLSTTLQPSEDQNLQITFTTQFYSLFVPNPVFQAGNHFQYSVSQYSPGGGNVPLVTNGTIAGNPVSSSGSVFTVTATIDVTTTSGSTCYGDSCVTSYENLTVTLQASVSTYLALWTSPTVTIVFSSLSAYQDIPKSPPPSPNGYYIELYGTISAIVSLDSFVAFLALRKPELLVVAGLAALALGVEFYVWVVLGGIAL